MSNEVSPTEKHAHALHLLKMLMA